MEKIQMHSRIQVDGFAHFSNQFLLLITPFQKSKWRMTTCNHALYALVDVFTQYYDSLAPILLPNVYQQLFWCVQQGNEQLARSGINCLENLIVSNGEKFTQEMWERTVELIKQIFDCSMPDL